MPDVYPGEGQTPRQAAVACAVRPSLHAKKRQLQRGIEEKEIRDLIRTGTLTRAERIDSSSFHQADWEPDSEGLTPEWKWESWNRYLGVPFNLAPCQIHLVTVMYRRR